MAKKKKAPKRDTTFEWAQVEDTCATVTSDGYNLIATTDGGYEILALETEEHPDRDSDPVCWGSADKKTLKAAKEAVVAEYHALPPDEGR